MNYGLAKNLTLDSSDCLVLGLLDDKKFPDFVSNLKPAQQDLIKRLSARLDDNGDTVWQADIDGHSLMIIHCGKQEKFSGENLHKRMQDIAANVLKHRLTSVTISMPEVQGHDADWQVEQMILDFDAACYQLLDFKSKDKKSHKLQSVEFYSPKSHQTAVDIAVAISQGVRLTRTLANTPANICTPSYIADQAIKLTHKNERFSARILGKEDMEELGMGALLAVAKGSNEPPKLVEIHYNGGGDKAPIVLVGKGITFDSGGLSLKPADAMTEMKYDMTGAAAVLGTVKACALLDLPINVIGLMACAENMPSALAVKPGDIVTSMSGQTIEILNTDAEGRLVLADALTYAEQFKPEMVLDIATLTGAMIIALGSVYTGFMTKDDELAKLITKASKESGDKAWRLPLDDAYQKAMDSHIADMANVGSDRAAGSITAACFLSRFTKKYAWAHLDIAGSAWISGRKCDATGRPVPLLTQLLRHVAAR